MVDSVRASEWPVTDLQLFENRITAFNWHATENPIALRQSSFKRFGNAGFQFSNEYGDFKRPQEAQETTRMGFGGKGANLYKHFNFYGDFAYERITKNGVQFSNVSRPYDGNPFITADSIGGDWKGDQLMANLHIAYPTLGKWRLGSKINYLVEQSSRRNDPRPLYRYLNMSVNQIIGYQLNATGLASIQLGYKRKTEEVETGQYTSISYKLYSLRGYGTYDYVPVVSALRYTTASGWNVGLGYLYEDANTAFHLQTGLSYITEDVTDEPIFVGGYDELCYSLIVGYQKKKNYLTGWSITLSGKVTDGTGYDPRFAGTNPSLHFIESTAEFAYWRPVYEKSWIRISYLPAWQSINYKETIAKTAWWVSKLHQDISVKWVQKSSPGLQLEASPAIGYHFPIQGELDAARPTVITRLLVEPDYTYANQSYLKTSLGLGATLSTQKLTYRFQASYSQFSSYELGNRNWTKCTLQILF
jgi:hypothetical protein